jgi:hypothetical protein
MMRSFLRVLITWPYRHADPKIRRMHIPMRLTTDSGDVVHLRSEATLEF